METPTNPTRAFFDLDLSDKQAVFEAMKACTGNNSALFTLAQMISRKVKASDSHPNHSKQSPNTVTTNGSEQSSDLKARLNQLTGESSNEEFRAHMKRCFVEKLGLFCSGVSDIPRHGPQKEKRVAEMLLLKTL